MKKKERQDAANARTRAANIGDNTLQPRAQAFQMWLIQNLLRLVGEGRSQYPGVWHSRTLEDMENLALQLDELAENGVVPDIILAWQPPLLPNTDHKGLAHNNGRE